MRRLDHLTRDLAYAARGIRRNLGFTLVAVGILALGIGANTTIFRFVSALLLQPPPVQSPETLLQVWNLNPRSSSSTERYYPLSYPAFAHFRDGNRSFSAMVAYDGDPHTLSWVRAGRGEVVQGQFVSGNFFTTLGVKAAIGTTVLPPDDARGSAPTVVVSHRFWRERLGADPTVVGTTIMLNGVACSVAGIAPAGFAGLLGGLSPDVWVPFAIAEAVRHERGLLTNRSSFWLFGVGRLTAGATAQQANAELTVLARQLSALDASTAGQPSREGFDAAVFPATLIPGPFRGQVAAFVALLQIVVLMVLLIACANAGNLFLAQAAARHPELALRSALGASRGRLVQLVLVQTALLGLLAGGAGLLLARQTAPAMLRLIPPALPVHLELTMDWRVTTFALSIALGAGLLFGLAPALRGTRNLMVVRQASLGGRRLHDCAMLSSSRRSPCRSCSSSPARSAGRVCGGRSPSTLDFAPMRESSRRSICARSATPIAPAVSSSADSSTPWRRCLPSGT
jgi:putative ABC transport system permease protein